MPYKRKYKRQTRKSAYSLAKKALKKVNRIRAGVETKFTDNELDRANVDWNGEIIPAFNDPLPGTDDTERIGDSVLCTSAHIRYRVAIGSSGLNTQFRIIVFWDKKNTINATNDILAFVGQNNATLAHYNVDRRSEWVKLWDHSFMLLNNHIRVRDFVKRFKLMKKTQYSAGTALINSGSIKMLVISNISDLASIADKPDSHIESRVFYTDS